MNQEKIGKFIAKCRKVKKLTQSELAQKLGVTDRSVSNWENGKNMPDLSLFKPLCQELDITINELLSGEELKSDIYQDKFEENIVNTIDYTNRKVNQKNSLIGVILLVFGILISLTAVSIFPSESSWSSFYSVFGCIISLIGFSRFTKKFSYLKRLLFNFGFFVIFVVLLFVLDYINVINNSQAPRFSLVTETNDNVIFYKTPFYNVFKINRNTLNEYYIIDVEKEYTIDTVPRLPFNRNRSGIDNIIKFKNKYIGDNSNVGSLISNLPLSEYGYVFEIDSINLSLTIDYHITDWYINNNMYLEKSLIYNSVSIFCLIENVQSIVFNFSGNSYRIERNDVEGLYPNYLKIINNNEIDKNNFNKFVEQMMNNNEFINNMFNLLF